MGDVLANFLNGQSDAAAIDLHADYALRYIDVPQTGWYDAGTPIFDGSIDWHSAVHAHLAVVLDLIEDGDPIALADFVITTFPAADVQAEADANVNDPYGWAWLLKLDSTLRAEGYDDLAPAGDAYAARLETHLDARAGAGTLDNGSGSYGDAYWMVANLHDWAETTGDSALMTRAEDLFDAVVADSDITASTAISEGDFFSQVGIAAYAHVVMGDTASARFDLLEQSMAEAVEDGTLSALLDAQGAALDSGVGFAHSPGVTVSLSYGYWALFAATQDPAHYAGFEQVVDWTETHAEALGGSIGPGHWLPNFAAYGASLPGDMEVAETSELVALLQGYGLDVPPSEADDPDDTSGDDTLVGGDGGDSITDSYALDGVDALLFVIDPETGDISYQDWFTPDPNDAWDQNEDHIYEVTRVALGTDGTELGRVPLQMEVTDATITWSAGTDTGDGSSDDETGGGDTGGNEAGGEDSGGGDTMGFGLSGPDAMLFVVDPATGAPQPQDWFTPDFDDAWDQDGDHLYEVTVTEPSADGTTTAIDWQLTVSASGSSWTAGSVADSGPTGPGDGSGDAPDDIPNGGPVDTATSFVLEGPDAFLFEVDCTGGVTPKDWFIPDHDDPWDQDEDNTYEVTRIETAPGGTEIARDNLLWEALPDNSLQPVMDAPTLMRLLATQDEDDILPEPLEDTEE